MADVGAEAVALHAKDEVYVRNAGTASAALAASVTAAWPLVHRGGEEPNVGQVNE